MLCTVLYYLPPTYGAYRVYKILFIHNNQWKAIFWALLFSYSSQKESAYVLHKIYKKDFWDILYSVQWTIYRVIRGNKYSQRAMLSWFGPKLSVHKLSFFQQLFTHSVILCEEYHPQSGMFAETAIADYRLSLADQEKQTSVFRFRFQQKTEVCRFLKDPGSPYRVRNRVKELESYV